MSGKAPSIFKNGFHLDGEAVLDSVEPEIEQCVEYLNFMNIITVITLYRFVTREMSVSKQVLW